MLYSAMDTLACDILRQWATVHPQVRAHVAAITENPAEQRLLDDPARMREIQAVWSSRQHAYRFFTATDRDPAPLLDALREAAAYDESQRTPRSYPWATENFMDYGSAALADAVAWLRQADDNDAEECERWTDHLAEKINGYVRQTREAWQAEVNSLQR